MPHPIWRHDCRAFGSRIGTGAQICPYCGERGKFDGWGLSMVEHWGHYQRATGLPAFGPGRLPGTKLPIVRCGTCRGIGIYGTPDQGGPCPDCDGRGMWLDATEEEKAELLRRSEAAARREEQAGAGRVEDEEDRDEARDEADDEDDE